MESGLGSRMTGSTPNNLASEKYNKEGLAAVLRQTGDPFVELYGIWDGDFDFATAPAIREEISLREILEPSFRFKEQAFYAVRID